MISSWFVRITVFNGSKEFVFVHRIPIIPILNFFNQWNWITSFTSAFLSIEKTFCHIVFAKSFILFLIYHFLIEKAIPWTNKRAIRINKTCWMSVKHKCRFKWLCLCHFLGSWGAAGLLFLCYEWHVCTVSKILWGGWECIFFFVTHVEGVVFVEIHGHVPHVLKVLLLHLILPVVKTIDLPKTLVCNIHRRCSISKHRLSSKMVH